ncbi:HrpE/YscL family type III secretion apparatus protein [Phyllobacterium phragmitis]|uniref:HrpE/YscL family type III secretion apparatus protein n=1 Tax=Phyllobacterium phragmitis TaxID=2670329 RepID=A0A2S9IMJ7_9HYPH|nr:FliH/SctL family protein [Phyllobacterium phragmitis]PRD41754.1 HrpE/YscL family type III secretion apparatus protein [Phyllobacterium phragmitis]
MTEMPNRPLARIIRAEDATCWIDGFAFLDRAKADAAAIRSIAGDEVAKARQLGREEGRKMGEAEAAALLMRTHADVDRYLVSVEPMVAALAMEIVERVIGTIDDAELVARAARQALDALREDNAVIVNVAPELVVEVQQRLAASGSTGVTVRVAADRHLSARHCTVTTPSTSIDVSIESQLDAIRTAMIEQNQSGA